jgi:hypothetical protein
MKRRPKLLLTTLILLPFATFVVFRLAFEKLESAAKKRNRVLEATLGNSKKA